MWMASTRPSVPYATEIPFVKYWSYSFANGDGSTPGVPRIARTCVLVMPSSTLPTDFIGTTLGAVAAPAARTNANARVTMPGGYDHPVLRALLTAIALLCGCSRPLQPEEVVTLPPFPAIGPWTVAKFEPSRSQGKVTWSFIDVR